MDQVELFLQVLSAGTVIWAVVAGGCAIALAPRNERTPAFVTIGLLWTCTPLAFWLLPPGNGNYNPPYWWVPLLLLYFGVTVPPFFLPARIQRPLWRSNLTIFCGLMAAVNAAVLYVNWWAFCMGTW